MDETFGEMLDTSPAQRRQYYQLLRSLGPRARARKVSGLSHLVRTMALAGIRLRHPNATPEELKGRLAERLYGHVIAARVFGLR